MNCQDALNLLYDVIDKEASKIDVKEVEEHLARCRDCTGVYRLEQSVNELIREKLKHQEPTPRLDSLKAKVRSQLDQIECEAKAETPTTARPTFTLGRNLAIAASVIVVLGAAYFGSSFFDSNAAYLPLKQAHWTASDNPEAYRSSVATSLARVETQQRFAYDIIKEVCNYNLVGGQLETVGDVRLAHFVYHNKDDLVSVFIVDISKMPVPDDLLSTMVTRNGIEFFDHNCPSCRLVYHQVGKALIVTATTNRNTDLLDFVPGRGPV